MPIYAYSCPCGHEFERYVTTTTSPNPDCECGALTEKIWSVRAGRAWGGYPYVTKNIRPDGQPVTVDNPAHEAALCKEFGVTKRDDAGWVDTEYLGYDPRSDKQVYREGSGRGMPGCWV
jgi:putative FmdB family regulatory protein